jgi:hypothetical protein
VLSTSLCSTFHHVDLCSWDCIQFKNQSFRPTLILGLDAHLTRGKERLLGLGDIKMQRLLPPLVKRFDYKTSLKMVLHHTSVSKLGRVGGPCLELACSMDHCGTVLNCIFCRVTDVVLLRAC